MTNRSKLAIALLAVVAFSASDAFAVLTDFESFTPNQSVNGQGDWTVQDSFGNSAELFDEEVVDDGTGNQVWRVSNAYTNGSYSNQPFSAKSDSVAGETGAGLYNDYGTDHTMPNNPPLSSATAASPNFYGAFSFKSATGGSQMDINMAISAGASQSTLRQSYVRIQDSGTGYDVDFFDTQGTTFNNTVLATGLSYTDWNSIEMYISFVDGIGPGAPGDEAGNDILNILINGNLVHTGTTWESYFHNTTGPSPQAVDSLLFRQSGTAEPGNAGGGLYIDNVEVSNATLAAIPEPSSFLFLGLVSLAIGVVGGSRRRSRSVN